MPIHRFRLHLAKTPKTHKGIPRPGLGRSFLMPVAITPRCNIQFKAVRCSLRLLEISYAFLKNEKTELCS